LHPALDQIRKQFFVWISGTYATVGIVGLIMQGHVPRETMEDPQGPPKTGHRWPLQNRPTVNR
jgi:hypothetical protein